MTCQKSMGKSFSHRFVFSVEVAFLLLCSQSARRRETIQESHAAGVGNVHCAARFVVALLSCLSVSSLLVSPSPLHCCLTRLWFWECRSACCRPGRPGSSMDQGGGGATPGRERHGFLEGTRVRPLRIVSFSLLKPIHVVLRIQSCINAFA